MKDVELERYLRELPRDDVWELDVFPSPMPVREGAKVGFAPTGMVVHPASRFLLEVKLFPLKSDELTCVGKTLLAALDKHQRLPLAVHVRDAKWAKELAPTAKLLGFRFVVDKKLAVLRAVQRDMAEAMKTRLAPREKWGEA